MKRKASKGRVARDETFGEFLARDGLLGEAEELALKEIIADQIREAMKTRGLTADSDFIGIRKYLLGDATNT